MTILAAVLALVAAALFAVASAAQQRAAAEVPDEDARGLGLIRTLVRRPLWWVGTIGDGGGFVAQAAALGLGSLLLVQPLLVTTLLFALPLSARWAGRRLSRPDKTWALVLVAALAVFVVVGEPTAGVDRASLERWLPAAVVIGVVFAACAAGAAVRRGTTRAVLLAVCTALMYGATAALIKGTVSLIDDGVLAVVTAWETWALVVVVAVGTLLQQSAFQAGALGASLPIVTVGEPVVAVLLGIAVLDEQVQSSGAEWVLIGVLAVVMAVATAALARSSAEVTPVALSTDEAGRAAAR
jgi:drug/metabolite transporter (DMT)-like permease